jgi:hypothetical protein
VPGLQGQGYSDAEEEGAMRRSGYAAAAAIVLAACATTSKYEQMLQSFVGAEEVDLIRQWGPPQQVYESGGSKFLAYNRQAQVFLPGTPGTATTNFSGSTAYTTFSPGVAPMAITQSCMTVFELRDGRVASWRWQGNACKSK